jgi:hypothetical protein
MDEGRSLLGEDGTGEYWYKNKCVGLPYSLNGRNMSVDVWFFQLGNLESNTMLP